MPDNVTNAEATSGGDAPALSVSNWPGDKAPAVATPAPGGDNAGDAAQTPTDGGTPPAAEQTRPAEGEGGEAGASDPPPPDGEGGEATAADATADDATGQTRPDRSLSGRLSQRTRERNEERERADRLAGLLEKAIDKLGDKPGGDAPANDNAAPPPPPEQPDPRPRRDQFDDPDAYDEAVDSWNHRQSAKLVQRELARQEQERTAKQQREETEQRQRDSHAQAVTRWNSEAEKLRADPAFEDFDDLLHDQTVPISAPLSAMLLSLDNGPRLFVELARNKAEAERISRLVLDPRAPGFNPNAALLELGRISERLASRRPQVSKSPPPIKPVGNSARAVPKSPNEESMEEYGARRERELNAQRRPGMMFGNAAGRA